jgi:hypothetical protein
MAQEPQIPSLQDRRNVRVGSISFLILISASKTIGPTALRSSVYSFIKQNKFHSIIRKFSQETLNVCRSKRIIGVKVFKQKNYFSIKTYAIWREGGCHLASAKYQVDAWSVVDDFKVVEAGLVLLRHISYVISQNKLEIINFSVYDTCILGLSPCFSGFHL